MTISVKENSKRISGNSFSPLGAQNKDIGAASRTLLTEVKLHTSTTQATPYVYRGKSHMGRVIQVGSSKQAIKW